jgi:hypothetical protein
LKAGDLDLSKACSGPQRCEAQLDTKCQSEVAAIVGCFLNNLDAVCGGVTSENENQSLADACEDAVRRFTTCEAAQDTDNTVKNCTPGGDCECANACEKCQCKADDDLQELAACAESGGPCAP